MLEGKKLAVIGVGKLGEALISGLLKNGALKAEDVCGTVGRENSISRVREKLPIAVSLDNKEAVKGKDLILLAVKPQNMAKVLLEIKDVIEDHQLLISV
ncbi:MAG TPA: NAD(P)-binding domain-containing protein, partial [Candidatus Obscuribacter sp.]|nr:NAD(P)-binding domain-containing protein [Candidatus Obscuribacter sp.]